MRQNSDCCCIVATNYSGDDDDDNDDAISICYPQAGVPTTLIIRKDI